MTIELVFIIREPGNHHEIARLKSCAVPREGECVALDRDGQCLVVHQVTHVFAGGKHTVDILVK